VRDQVLAAAPAANERALELARRMHEGLSQTYRLLRGHPAGGGALGAHRCGHFRDDGCFSLESTPTGGSSVR